jgi:hypothetical protein
MAIECINLKVQEIVRLASKSINPLGGASQELARVSCDDCNHDHVVYTAEGGAMILSHVELRPEEVKKVQEETAEKIKKLKSDRLTF